MDIKIIRNYTTTKGNRTADITENISQFVTSVTLSGSDIEAARSLEFALVHAPYDNQINPPILQKGDRISFYEGGKRLFYGKVTSRERTGESGEATYTAKDFMDNLLKSKISGKYKNHTAEYIAKAACKAAGISAGYLVKTGTRLNRLFATDTAAYNVAVKAYKMAAKKTGIQYFPRMNGSKFEVVEKGKLVGRSGDSLGYVLHQDYNVTGARISDNADNMVNRVQIFSDSGKKIGTVSNSKWIKLYGVYQESYKKESKKEKNTKKKARAMLQGSEQSIDIEAIGDSRCISGAGIYIYDKPSGLYGKFWIKSDSHSWSDGKHTMSLTLTLKNVTENPEVSYEEDKKSSSSGYRTTNRMLGRRVKALFTGYYPANNALQGGFVAANGEKLNPAKRTCAAPPQVKFGKKIQVLSTHTKQDNRIFRVNDRGGAIKVKNGRYHIDLLFKNHASAYAFGRRTGYAVIGSGKMKKVKVNAPSKKAKKILKYAASFLGRVSYAHTVDMHKSGRCRTDCSGYVYHVFRHFGIINQRLTAQGYGNMNRGKKINKISQLKPGDLVLMHCGINNRKIDHIAICWDSKTLINVGTRGCRKVKISAVRHQILFGRRLL